MTFHRTMKLVLVCALSGCAQPATPEQQILNDAAAALGGRDRILAVKSLVLEGEGKQFNLGQDMTPGATGQTFSVTALKRVVDVATGRMRTELTRTPNFAYFQGQAPQRQVQALDGEIAFNVAPNGNATRMAGQGAQDRRAELYHHPVTLVRAALAPGATVANVRTAGQERLVDVTTPDQQQFTLAVDGEGLPTRVESRSYHINLGDVVLSTVFSDYQDVGSPGVKLPQQISTKVDDFTTAELRYTTQHIDADVGDLAAPAAVQTAAAPSGPPPVTVTAEEVGKGLWFLAGQSHHSVVAEFADHLMLIEAPQSEARTLAVIAKARELRPDKPLTHVVTTHHHFDHTAGIRAAIAEGLTVITHAGNKAFFEDMARRAHTVVQDALARNPKPVTIEAVEGEREIKDATMSVMLYHVAGSPHSDTMLMAYFPRDRALVEVDVFSPAAAVHPYAANLLENIRKRNLRVDRIVPLHGTIAPFAELVKAAGAATMATSE